MAALFDSASMAQEMLPFTTKFCNTNRLSRCTWTHMQGQLLAGMHANLGMTSRRCHSPVFALTHQHHQPIFSSHVVRRYMLGGE